MKLHKSRKSKIKDITRNDFAVIEEDDVIDEDDDVMVDGVVEDEGALGADFTVIGVAVPGGRPRFLAG